MQGIPDALYMDNGPITRSRVFQNVMECLGVRVMTHLPAGKDGRRVTARSKGKVERPFRTVKEMNAALCHFHETQGRGRNQCLADERFMFSSRQPLPASPKTICPS
jgi:hypothetical protein